MRHQKLDAWTKAALVLTFGVNAGGCDDFEPRGTGEALSFDRAAPIGRGRPDDATARYIVMMKPGSDPRAAAAAVEVVPDHVFGSVITGFAAPLNPHQLEGLGHRPDVERIEADQIVTADTVVCPDSCPEPTIQLKDTGLAYGVDRVDQVALPLSNSYSYTCSGSDVEVYVFDTGIETSHPEFEGRAKVAYDALKGDGQDCNGHGTHVAGIVGGKTYGVAKGATLYSVRVLDCDGSGSYSKLIAGMDWVAKHHKGPAVANMSLSGSSSRIVNAAVDKLADGGVVVAVAAGNNNGDACARSPSGASRVIAVAASNSNDQRASFSNYGECVDVYAPGTNIRSAWLGGTNRPASGTSMSSPHVAGVAALYKQTFGDVASSQIKSDIELWATPNLISGNPANTVNSLIYWPCSM